LPAATVEYQRPFNDAHEAEVALHEAEAELLKFYCAYHAPFAVSVEVRQRAEDALLRALSTSVSCAKRGDHRYASVCVLYMRRCVKRCQPIVNLLHGINWDTAQQSLQEAWKRREAAKRIP
jgi:hypothetical protein